MNENLQNETRLKFLMIGDSGAGKTSLFTRYTSDEYLENRLCVLQFSSLPIKFFFLVNRNRF